MIGSFTPIPFKVFTILSGCLNFPLWRLIGYAAVGRAVKFYAVGALFYFYGRAAETMVKDVSLYIFLGGVPIIALFLFIRHKIRKKKKALKQLDEANADNQAHTDQPDIDQPSANIQQNAEQQQPANTTL